MEKEELIIEAATMVHEDWCKQEIEAFYNRAKQIYENGGNNFAGPLYKACYKDNVERNEIYIDTSFLMGHEYYAENCYDDFNKFMKLIKMGILEIKRFVPRNLTDEEARKKSMDGDYNKFTKKENILKEFKYLSSASQKENLEAAISAYTVFEELYKAGVSIEEMKENLEIRNLIGVGIHTDWMKRNPNHPNENLKVSYSKLDPWTKQQDLTVFDAVIKAVEKNGIIVENIEEKVSIPNYILEESKTLENLQKKKEETLVNKNENENFEKYDESSIEGLYVVCKMSDDFEVLEPFEQHFDSGRCLHKLVVFPKRILVYARTDKNGDLVYYNADTNEKIEIMDELTPFHSYESSSNPTLNLLEMIKQGISTGIPTMNEELMDKLEKIYNQYGLLMPFEDYYEQKFRKPIENISLKTAKRILKMMNLFVNKSIILSTNPSVAAEQLEKIGYNKKEKDIKKR